MQTPDPFPATRKPVITAQGVTYQDPTEAPPEDGSSFVNTMGDVADTVVGGLFRAIGYAGFHVHRIPAVKQGMNYVGGCVQEGYAHAHRSQMIHTMVRKIAHDRAQGPVSVDTIVSMCKDRGLPAEAIERVLRLADEEAQRQADQAYGQPAVAGA